MSKSPPKAKLLNTIPEERYRMIDINAVPPKTGDVVQLDQGFTSENGRPMVLAYAIREDGDFLYQVEVYESELGPEL